MTGRLGRVEAEDMGKASQTRAMFSGWGQQDSPISEMQNIQGRNERCVVDDAQRRKKEDLDMVSYL